MYLKNIKMKARVHREKHFVAVKFKFGDWMVVKIAKNGTLHGGIASAHAFVPDFQTALPILRKTNIKIPSSGWDKRFIDKNDCKSQRELFEAIWNNRV